MKSLSISVVTIAIVMVTYWAGGGNFERGDNLGVAVGLSIVSAIITVIAFNDFGEK